MNKNIGKVLPYDKFIKPDKSTSIQDLFMSACAYIDTKKIELYIDNKIIISCQHFYVLITSFIWKLAKIAHYTKGKKWNKYNNSITDAEKVIFCDMIPQDWITNKYYVEMHKLLIIFIQHGMNPTKEIYKLLISLGCYAVDFDHLFTFDKEEMYEINRQFKKFEIILQKNG